jgi:hypothetical protein
MGITIGQVGEILSSHLHTHITAGGLLDGWNRLAMAVFPWDEQIAEQARAGAVLSADETGWRVDGQTWWLWCFTNHHCCYYMIDQSRGSAALQKFFIEAFGGTLVTDFWGPYESVCAADYQKCLPHLLRELLKVDEHNKSDEWTEFSKQLKRLVRDGIRLRKRPDFTPQLYASRITLIHRRLCALADDAYTDADASRLGQRLSRYRDQLFTFLDNPLVPHDIKGQGIYAYVTLIAGEEPSEGLRKELVQWVRKEIGPIASPDLIQFAPGLPKTRSGKIMRRILRKIAEDDFSNLGDTSTLADPSVVTDLNDNRQNKS